MSLTINIPMYAAMGPKDKDVSNWPEHFLQIHSRSGSFVELELIQGVKIVLRLQVKKRDLYRLVRALEEADPMPPADQAIIGEGC